jgi:hypothetical protein
MLTYWYVNKVFVDLCNRLVIKMKTFLFTNNPFEASFSNNKYSVSIKTYNTQIENNVTVFLTQKLVLMGV